MADMPTNFLDMLNEADSIVRADYPEAGFYEASIDLGLVGSPWQFVFSAPPTGTVFLKNFEGQFQTPPEHVDKPWGGDFVIPLPIDLDLGDAQALCDQQGCGGDVQYITLRWPLVPGDHEPYYIFGIPSQDRRCFVGVRTRQVTCDEMQSDS
jgi:hypothetical protein